ncbi:MAG: ribose-phosphate diphosphokinase, partial [Lactobacillus helsingborgensis]|nr:ribose-phosphate diphosphokinase [Lactobacillus helsingborgensis]
RNNLQKDAVVVSPDHGGVTRARKLAEFLKTPIAIVDKRRPRANVSEVMNIIGNVKGKRAIIIDDMIDTAGTITLAAQALIDAGATEVYASATHAVLSGPAIQRLNDSPIKNLVLTDSINQPVEKKLEKTLLVSVGPLIGDAIKCIQKHEALSPLFNTRYEKDKHK